MNRIKYLIVIFFLTGPIFSQVTIDVEVQDVFGNTSNGKLSSLIDTTLFTDMGNNLWKTDDEVAMITFQYVRRAYSAYESELFSEKDNVIPIKSEEIVLDGVPYFYIEFRCIKEIGNTLLITYIKKLDPISTLVLVSEVNEDKIDAYRDLIEQAAISLNLKKEQ